MQARPGLLPTLTVVLLALAARAAAEETTMATLSVAETSCEYAVNPVGIDTLHPRFGWILHSNRRATMQQAYQVLVASSKAQLDDDTGDLWNTGKVVSGESANIAYQGQALVSRQQCFWKVRVWDNQGHTSPWSDLATFDMALLEPSSWHGQWIGLAGPDNQGVSPLLRKQFDIHGPIKRAHLYAAGIGWSEYWLNGMRVGDAVLDPAATDYDKRVLYVTHDVTALLRPGDNALGVMLGNGWYSEPVSLNYGAVPRLLLELVVERVDGEMQRLSSDESWRATTGPIVRNDLYRGEEYDARLEKIGWLEPGYDDTTWAPAAVQQPPGGRLEAQMIEPIRVNTVLRPLRLTQPRPGVAVYDFGQVFGGWARIRLRGAAGSRVTLRYATHVFPDDAALPAIIDRDVAAGHATRVSPEPGLVDKRHHHGADGATDVYILKGDPEGECYEPRFAYHPVRYVQVEGYPGEPGLDDLDGCMVYSAVDMTGEFQCSNPLLNQIHRNCLNTFTNTALGIEMDCLYREHWGWLDPGSVASMLFARRFMPRFWEKFLSDAQSAQHPDGVIPDVIPAYPLKQRTTGDPAWAGNYPLAVWYVYQSYGDRQVLASHYSAMRRWLAYLTTLADENHRIETGGYYGDHMLPGDAPGEETFISKLTPPPFLWTGYYYLDAWIVAQTARILGHDEDADACQHLAQAIRTALNDTWFDATIAGYATGSQTANAFALALGIVPEDHQQGVLNSLTSNIMQTRRGHLHTGNIGTTAVVDALARLGGAEVLHRVVTSTDYPGWGYMVSQGATTIWEAWGNVQDGFIGYNSGEDSMPMFASIDKYLTHDVAGLGGPDVYGSRLVAPGYRECSIRPRVLGGDVTWASASIRTVRGMVGVRWERHADRVTLNAAIPVNAMARISVPKMGLHQVTVDEGGKRFWQNGACIADVPGIAFGLEEPTYVTFDVGSGVYAFTLRGQP